LANIFRTISTKSYQNWPSFVDYVTKNIWYVFWFAVPIAVHLQNANAKFHKFSDIIQMSWKTF